ncbi:hypothetical protein EON80_28780, partial [bacterium]
MKPHFTPRLAAAIALLVTGSIATWAAPTNAPAVPAPLAPVKPVHLWAPVQDKNFYLLSLLEKTPSVLPALESDETLHKLTATYSAKLVKGFNEGEPSAEAIPTMLWTQPDIDAVAQALRTQYGKSKALQELVDGPLRQSAMYERYRADSGAELLVKAWRDAAAGINHVIQVYGLGGAPHYPKIDSAFYDVKSPPYLETTNIMFGVLSEDKAAQQLFFQPSLRTALALMAANRRDEAGRFEPLESGENAAALKQVSKIDWNKYPYALILAPGH